MVKIFRGVYVALLVNIALVVGAACYQCVSVVPFWLDNISMFRNHGQWGNPYFPILSPAMTLLWLATVIIGSRVEMKNKKLLYAAHGFFFLVMTSTFVYFVPFLMTYMGHPEVKISDAELLSKLEEWAFWDRIRQATGLIPLVLFVYCHGDVSTATWNGRKKSKDGSEKMSNPEYLEMVQG